MFKLTRCEQSTKKRDAPGGIWYLIGAANKFVYGGRPSDNIVENTMPEEIRATIALCPTKLVSAWASLTGVSASSDKLEFTGGQHPWSSQMHRSTKDIFVGESKLSYKDVGEQCAPFERFKSRIELQSQTKQPVFLTLPVTSDRLLHNMRQTSPSSCGLA